MCISLCLLFVRSPKAIVHTLAPRELLNYTWDDPEGKKVIRWTFPSTTKIHNRKPIEIIKVLSYIQKFAKSGHLLNLNLQDSQTAFTMKFPRNTTPSADDPNVSMSRSIFHVSSQGDY